MSAIDDPESALHSACVALRAAGTSLLTRAQQAGLARPDLSGEELFDLIAALAAAGATVPCPARRADFSGAGRRDPDCRLAAAGHRRDSAPALTKRPPLTIKRPAGRAGQRPLEGGTAGAGQPAGEGVQLRVQLAHGVEVGVPRQPPVVHQPGQLVQKRTGGQHLVGKSRIGIGRPAAAENNPPADDRSRCRWRSRTSCRQTAPARQNRRDKMADILHRQHLHSPSGSIKLKTTFIKAKTASPAAP